MKQFIWVVVIPVFLAINVPIYGDTLPWDADDFPNIQLTTQDGETVRFFDDLIKDKVVVINFIYTYCPDTCPLQTAKLVAVQKIFGDRLGNEVFFYSITIDPERDTLEVLKEYKKAYGARWTFLSGKKSEIDSLRKKLGLYFEESEKGSLHHNVSMIIGNQKTGSWLRRGPFENPHVLADQIGKWLPGWQSPVSEDDYLTESDLHNISEGKNLFYTRCSSCHSCNGDKGGNGLGPDLLGVTLKRDMKWLTRWIREPDKMLAEKDPIAASLFEKYNRIAMPNLRLSEEDVEDLIKYIKEEELRILGQSKVETLDNEETGDVLTITDTWIRESSSNAKESVGCMTLVNVGAKDQMIIKIESDLFERVEVHEVARVGGLSEVHKVTELVIPANGNVKLEQGGKHLILVGPKEKLKVGQKVDLTLLFGSNRKQKVTIEVKK